MRELQRKLNVSTAQEGLSAQQRQKVFDFNNFLDTPSSTRLLRDDPAAWRKSVTDLARGLPFDDTRNVAKFEKGLEPLLKKAIVDAKKAAASTKKVSIEEAREATAKGIQAVRANFESRAAASAFVREKVADLAKIDAEPLLVKLTDKYKAIGRENLAP